MKEEFLKLPCDGEPGSLLGRKCKACEEYLRPPRVVRANCLGEDMEEVALSRRGRVYTYRIGRVAFPGTPVIPPFITALVELPEKIQVLNLVTGLDIDKVLQDVRFTHL